MNPTTSPRAVTHVIVSFQPFHPSDVIRGQFYRHSYFLWVTVRISVSSMVSTNTQAIARHPPKRNRNTRTNTNLGRLQGTPPPPPPPPIVEGGVGSDRKTTGGFPLVPGGAELFFPGAPDWRPRWDSIHVLGASRPHSREGSGIKSHRLHARTRIYA